MRLTRYFLPVVKETPADAQIVSHKLMLRAGLIRQTAAGISDKLAELVGLARERPREPVAATTTA